jgi:glutathione peroxidase
MNSIYNITVKDNKGKEVSLSEYMGKVLLIVNTASKCGFTPQYNGLQEIYEKYKDKGFEILAFPCNQFMNQEPGSNDEIESFCSLNYGVKFRIFDKIDVKGSKQHPLFKYLTEESGGFLSKEIKWNFTKFLISPQGKIIKRYSPTTTPESIEPDIRRLLDI